MIARALLLITLYLVSLAPAFAEEGMAGLVIMPLQALVGEDRSYGIDFLFFNRLAEGELRFAATDTEGVFKAELVGRTLGIASWLAGDRTQTYTSTMRWMPDGTLHSIEHVSHIRKKRWGTWTNRQKVRRFDYVSRPKANPLTC